MRLRLFLLAAACGLLVAPSAVAQNAEAPRSQKTGSKGFEWFFANSPRPDGPCVGQHVVATWYASGKRTANGDAFNPDGLTAAHRTLPFGSRVAVTNPRTGQTVTVVINDRGPFVKGVTLDLARGAARAIGMKDTQWVCMSEARQP